MKKGILFLLVAFSMILSAFSGFVFCTQARADSGLKISSKSAILIDYDSGRVVFEKNPDEKLPIASMTKIATLSVVFDALERGIIRENDMVRVSENASKVGGSSAFLDSGASYKLSDLIKSVIIASANDSSVALAEHVAGSESAFVLRMNKLAENLGLKGTHFENSTGLPCSDHYSTARDIAEIYRTICDNGIFKKYSKIWMDDFIHPSGRKTGLVNTNRLIRTFEGIEGGKTGYTDEAKFCLTASAKRGMTRFIGVVIGASDSKTRFREMTELLSFGFAGFESKLVVNSLVPVTIASVQGSENKIEVYPERDSLIFTEKNGDESFTSDYRLNQLSAPIKQGDIVGKIFVFDKDNMVVDEINLISGSSAERQSLAQILKNIVSLW